MHGMVMHLYSIYSSTQFCEFYNYNYSYYYIIATKIAIMQSHRPATAKEIFEIIYPQ